MVQAIDATPDAKKRKCIVLFSDGTGNSSSKLQKTNVWRLYEAMDLGYPANNSALVETRKRCGKDAPNAHDEVQLAYYDDGVGTSTFRLLAILGGVFGFGLARNIRDLYKFLCRNFDEHADDRIYAFGFSRGAYTIRLLISLVTTMGCVPYQSEAQLDRAARDMWREYRRFFHTNNRWTDLLVACGRAFVRTLIRIARLPSGIELRKRPSGLWAMRLPDGGLYAACVPEQLRRGNFMREWWDFWWTRKDQPVDAQGTPSCGPPIEFVGVWDTVAAYGGPVVEITRAVDEWIWPLTMPNYRLSEKVRCARHALAIDDKRDSFQPLLWDEPNERALECWNEANPRLQQVWFAGMHADVGGGYSDESLSFVSLWWMIGHAEQAGLRLLPDHVSRIDNLRNVYGPIHDSRGGAGAFYRYQPRYINAWIDWNGTFAGGRSLQPATQVYRDPTIDRDPRTGKGRYETRGLLAEPIRVHRSVVERLKMSTDGYGPNNLPPHYWIDDGVNGVTPAKLANPVSLPLIYELGDRIKARRFWYFLSFGMALLLALRPFWDEMPLLEGVGGRVDARTDAQILELTFNAFLPEFAEKWTNAIAADPFGSLILVLFLLAFTALGVRHEWAMTDISRTMWRHMFAPKGTDQPVPVGKVFMQRWWLDAIRFLRRCDPLQGVLAWWKWRAVPVVLGLAMFAAGSYGVLAAATQLWLVRVEQRPWLCPDEPHQAGNFGDRVSISIANPCADLGLKVEPSEKPQRFALIVQMRQGDGSEGEWRDETSPATPLGWNSVELPGLRKTIEASGVGPRLPEWAIHLASAAPHDGSKFLRRVVSADLLQPVIELRRRYIRQGIQGRLGRFFLAIRFTCRYRT